MNIELLARLGANTDEGVKRCAGNEMFYLKMVTKALEEERYRKLEESVLAKDLDAAFDEVHALKGILANLSLTPIYKPVEEMTELLRNRQDTDYSKLLEEMWEKRNSFYNAMGED